MLKQVELYNICLRGRTVDNGWLVRVSDAGRTTFVKFDRDEAAARAFASSDESLAHGAYRAAVIIDELYSAELRSAFGKRAGDVRYTAEGKGEVGTHLRRLHIAKLEADALMRACSATVSP